MNNSSSRERLRLAHEMIDKELEGNFLGPSTASQSNRTKNVQSQISDLQKKLMDLERKMENIDVSSSNDESDNLQVFKKRLDSAVSKEKKNSRQRIVPPPQVSSRKAKKPEILSSDEDSQDDNEIYAKIPTKKQKNQPILLPRKTEEKKNVSSIVQEIQKKTSTKQGVKNPMKESVKSVKSIKSINSRKSNNSRKSIDLRKSNLSRISNKSLSRDFSRGSIGSGTKDMRDLEIENAKDSKKISNLERELKHYKRLCKKQEERVEQYRVMEIEFRKLQANFAKSEQIRKQQKKIIQSLKGKN